MIFIDITAATFVEIAFNISILREVHGNLHTYIEEISIKNQNIWHAPLSLSLRIQKLQDKTLWRKFRKIGNNNNNNLYNWEKFDCIVIDINTELIFLHTNDDLSKSNYSPYNYKSSNQFFIKLQKYSSQWK